MIGGGELGGLGPGEWVWKSRILRLSLYDNEHEWRLGYLSQHGYDAEAIEPTISNVARSVASSVFVFLM